MSEGPPDGFSSSCLLEEPGREQHKLNADSLAAGGYVKVETHYFACVANLTMQAHLKSLFRCDFMSEVCFAAQVQTLSEFAGHHCSLRTFGSCLLTIGSDI